MPSYRVETALSKRASCQATECKKAGIKIDKDELRLGTWVDYGDTASWKWRHWGCVSGLIIKHIRDEIEDPAHPGVYRWDYLDGYEGDEKNSLDKHPDLQEKVRNVITNGKHDLGDFNGDEEMNVLGETGLRTAESKKRIREEQKAQLAREREEAQAQAQEASDATTDAQSTTVKTEQDEKKVPTTAIKRVKPESDREEEEPKKKKPAKSRAKKVKEEQAAEDEEMPDLVDDEPAKPTKKSRAKKSNVKIEDDEASPNATEAPAKKSRAKKNTVKVEADEEGANVSEAVSTMNDAPAAKRARGKKAVKQEDEDETDEPSEAKPAPKKRGPRAKKTDNAEGEPSEAKSAPKKRAPRGKKAAKEEPIEDEASTTLLEQPAESAVKDEPSEAVDMPSAPTVNDSSVEDPVVKAPALKDASQDAGIDKAEAGDFQATGAEADGDADAQPKKKGRAKKAAAPAKSSRPARSRTNSKA